MRVNQVMSRDVATCRPAESLAHAAQLMWDRDVGCLPVVDGEGHVVAIVTDRDACMAAYLRGAPLHAIPVAVAMASPVLSCRPDDDVAEVEQRMSAAQVRRMPVIDDHGHPVGVVSLNDLARAGAQKTISAGEVAATLAAVCAPRSSRITAA